MSESPPRERGRPRGFDRSAALETAMILFWRNGFEGTSMSQLTTAMGIAPPSLYAAFGSKEAIYTETLDLYVRTMGDLGVVRLTEAPTARDGVGAILRTAAEAFTRPDTPPGCMVGVGSLRVGEQNGYAAEAAARLRANSLALLRQRLEAARSSGELAAECDTGSLADYYAAVLEGMSVAAIDGAGRARLFQIADLAMRSWPDP